ncbi:phage/plasmid primase, P4 family [Roseomonas chloroacetimidivorans]|uniref:phage/plasmid primase, P4 family n=1 Tax=Roseomonas chloroacetimidivorans TaxID=1766656 RepID=UPI003C71EFC0
MAWQEEYQKGRRTKVPYDPATGRQAASNRQSTWAVRAAAEERVPKLRLPCGTGGIGIMLGHQAGLTIGGIDLDTCRAETGDLAPWALEVVRRFSTYAEVSPSGSGVKLFFLYDPKEATAIRQAMGTATGRKWAWKGGDHPPGIEFYISGRFFAVTGERHPGAPEELRRVALADLEWLIREAGPAMAGKCEASARKPGRISKALGVKPKAGDGSRSAMAFKIAAQVKRECGDFPAFLDALDGNPDTADWKAEKGQAEGGRELRRCWERAGEAVEQDVLLTEHGVALAFTKRFKDRLRYCHDTGAWFEWTGTHWRKDRKHAAFSFARRLVADANRKAEFKTQAVTGKAAFAGGVEKFAQRDSAHAVTNEAWDRDPYLLATPGGVVDLRTGRMRTAQPADMMTRITAVAPSRATPPDLWLRFLDETTGRDDELIDFLKRWCGYCLTGDTNEHALLFGHGPGGNGKSVFLNTVARILGDYAAVAAMDTFTASFGDKHPTDLAMLRGARLVTATETEEGRAWAESRINQMTGGDPISARFMRQDFFTYRPQFKLTIVGNHKPILKNVNEAARRRFNIVPFTRKPVTPDRELEAKLEAEWPAILAWMIEGCLEWQESGLPRPKVVAEATAEYFEAQDHFSRWLEECCFRDPVVSERPGKLLANFTAWCDANGEDTADNRRLRGMIERVPGLRYAKVQGFPWVRGLRLLTEQERGQKQEEAEQQGEGGKGGEGSNP